LKQFADELGDVAAACHEGQKTRTGIETSTRAAVRPCG
jgi:hypothetical protein